MKNLCAMIYNVVYSKKEELINIVSWEIGKKLYDMYLWDIEDISCFLSLSAEKVATQNLFDGEIAGELKHSIRDAMYKGRTKEIRKLEIE